MALPIYLDHHATTPVDPRVLAAMLPHFEASFGNPSSRNHRFGWWADDAVQEARDQVAGLIGARAQEIVFTSGATESDNLAILGGARARRDEGRHVVTTRIEHKAVLDACAVLEREGFAVSCVDPRPDGRVALADMEAQLRPDTVLVSCMWFNNEVGTRQPIEELGALCRARGITFHVDAVQGLAVAALDVERMHIDLLSLSAHKIYGPKGAGALYVRRRPRVPLLPLSHGGGQERGLRAGTLNVPGIVGLGQACALAQAEWRADAERVGRLRDRLCEALLARVPEAQVHGAREGRHPGNLSLAFPGVDAERLLLAVHEQVALSSGSACSSASLSPSHVLRAMGVPRDLARATIRIGLGRGTRAEEVERAAEAIGAAALRLRAERDVMSG